MADVTVSDTEGNSLKSETKRSWHRSSVAHADRSDGFPGFQVGKLA